MKTPESTPQRLTVVSLSMAALASGVGLAVNAWRRARSRALGALGTRLPREDKDAITRMEGEGGPSLGSPPQAP